MRIMKIPEKMRRQALTTKYHFIYKNIGQKIAGARIIFSSEGFRHLTRRGQRKRSIKDMRHRLSYLPLMLDRQIRMITRSIKNSTPHFQSIFEIQ